MKTTNHHDLLELFKQLKIRKGDKVMVHGFFPSLGKIENGYKTFFDALLSSIGDKGTLIIPVFTYSYFNQAIYDVSSSKSTIGDFTNFFIEHYNCYRNLEPNFSMAGIGADLPGIIERENSFVFGRKGIYQKIEDHNVKFLLIGINWDQGLPFSMHIEHCFGVDYRYDKEFYGKTIDHSGILFEDRAIHYVRDLDRNPIRYRSRVGMILEERGMAVMTKFRYGIHRTVEAQKYAKLALEKMKQHPYFMLKEIDGKPVEIQ